MHKHEHQWIAAYRYLAAASDDRAWYEHQWCETCSRVRRVRVPVTHRRLTYGGRAVRREYVIA